MASTWLEEHLETFVRPYLGHIPKVDPKDWNIQNWTPLRIRALRAIWNQAKVRSGGRPIILAGRDVFLIEVLARLENYPTTFRSDISSPTVGLVKEDYSKYYCLDTGFRGSIPKALKCEAWDLISCYSEKTHQVFPRAKVYGHTTNVAGALETVSKYWTRARPNNYEIPKERQTIVQTLNLPAEFARAGIITIHVVNTILGRPSFGKKAWIYITDDKYYKLQGAIS